MNYSYQDILSNEDIEYIINLPEVINSKNTLINSDLTSLTFSISLNENIKIKLKEKVNLNLLEKTSIPLRWIKGDTPSHIDFGPNNFDNTYLTDSEGSLILDTTIYPIDKGTAYIFPERCR
jgi:hypothetical protein